MGRSYLEEVDKLAPASISSRPSPVLSSLAHRRTFWGHLLRTIAAETHEKLVSFLSSTLPSARATRGQQAERKLTTARGSTAYPPSRYPPYQYVQRAIPSSSSACTSPHASGLLDASLAFLPAPAAPGTHQTGHPRWGPARGTPASPSSPPPPLRAGPRRRRPRRRRKGSWAPPDAPSLRC